MEGKGSVQPVTILVRYDDEDGAQEERWPGFLTGDSHGMYVDDDSRRTLIFVRVEQTSDPTIFRAVKGFNELGWISDPSRDASIIVALAKKLHSITAYEFFTQVLINCKSEAFDDAIIPNFVS